MRDGKKRQMEGVAFGKGNFGNGKPRFGKDEIPRRIRNGKIKRSAGELGRRVRRLNI